MVQNVLGTSHPVYLLTASGTGAMEAAVLNVTSPGTRVLVVSAGKFGDRWAEIAESYGCQIRNERFPQGAAFDLSRISGAMEDFKPECVALTHVESSTGAIFPLKEFSGLMEKGPEGSRPVLIVDAIASVGAEDFRMDGWGIDVVAASGQKAFAGPAGIGFLSMNQRALAVARSSQRAGYYFRAKKYEEGRETGDTPFTPAIQSAQMLHCSLSVQARIGWDKMRARHRHSARAIVAAFGHLGLGEFPREPSVSVKALSLPAGIDGELFLEDLDKEFNIIAGRGQGTLKGKIIRFGFTGLYGGDTLKRVVKSVGELLALRGLKVNLEAAESEMAAVREQESIFK